MSQSFQQPSPQKALHQLRAGNIRFAQDTQSISFRAGRRRLPELARRGQNPFAIVLTCADSRMPAEHLFDCGPGELFVIRVAGNALTPEVIGSIEFAAMSFGTPLCLIMGHSRCGAITAAVESEMTGQPAASSSLQALLQHLRPAVKQVLLNNPQLNAEEAKQQATLENVNLSAAKLLRESPLLNQLVQEGCFQVTGALCELSTGQVNFLDSHSETLTESDAKERLNA